MIKCVKDCLALNHYFIYMNLYKRSGKGGMELHSKTAKVRQNGHW